MADGLQNIGNILAGFGAGVQGRGAEFLQGQRAQRKEQKTLSDERKKALVQDVAVGLDHLENGRVDMAIQLFSGLINSINQLGGDPSESQGTLDDLQAGKIDKVKDNLKGVVSAAQIRGMLPDTPTSKFLKTIGNKALFQKPDGTLDVQDMGEAGVQVSEGQEVKSSKILPGGNVQVVFKDGTTDLLTLDEAKVAKVIAAEERGAELQGLRAEKRTRGTKQEQRGQDLINRGTTAAESTATIRRGLELLETIETGGPQAISLAVQQRLGIEGADAGELSNSLGKSVLSQLRETFGAAFTAEEGKQLTRIEAGFGKSTAANKRLLQRALKIAERTSNRAVRAAKDRGDEATVEDIEDLLKFQLTFDDQGQTAGDQVQDLSKLSIEELTALRQQQAGQ